MSPTMSSDEYIRSGRWRVRGYLAEESVQLIAAVSNAQLTAGTTGSVGEIGVLEGRLFIFLCLSAQDNERAFAIDIFDNEDPHEDNTLKGSRKVFEENLRKFGIDMRRVSITARSSLEISPEELRSISGPTRLFSIDGAHSAAATLHDLVLAESVLVDGGVVVLDDVFSALFPGVVTALGTYLQGVGSLVPFAVCPQKVMLTQPAHHDRLLDDVARQMPTLLRKTDEFYGHKVAVIGRPASAAERLQVTVASSGAYQKLRETAVIGRAVEFARPGVLRMLGRL